MTGGGGAQPEVVVVSASLDRKGGGAAAFGRTLARTVDRFCHDHDLPFEILCLGEEGLELPDRRCRTFGSDFAGLARNVLSRQLVGERPVFVFDHLGPARTQALLPAALRSPYALTMLGIEVWRPLSWSRRRALRHARRIAISEHTLRRARERSPWLGDTAVVHPCLESDEPSPTDERATGLPGLPESFFLIVGRLSSSERYKGHDELLEAIARHRAAGSDEPAPMHLVVVGDGDDRSRLEGLARELGIGSRVTFTGFVERPALDALYQRCRALVLPSRDEGFGLVYLEAMRAGRPCVAARGSAAEEIVVDGETGLLVDPSSEQLDAALELLWREPERGDAFGDAGRRRYRERFSAERFAADLRPTLERLVA